MGPAAHAEGVGLFRRLVEKDSDPFVRLVAVRSSPGGDRPRSASRPACRNRTAACPSFGRVLIEAAARHGGDTDILHQIPGERDVVAEPEAADVGHDVVRARRRVADELVAAENLEQQVAPALVLRRQVQVVPGPAVRAPPLRLPAAAPRRPPSGSRAPSGWRP